MGFFHRHLLGRTLRNLVIALVVLTALGLVFAYYFVDALFQVFGRHGGMPPVVAGWGPVAIFGIVALALFRRAEK